MNRYLSAVPLWSPRRCRNRCRSALRSCYLLIFRRGIKAYQLLGPDPFWACARSRNLRDFTKRPGYRLSAQHCGQALSARMACRTALCRRGSRGM